MYLLYNLFNPLGFLRLRGVYNFVGPPTPSLGSIDLQLIEPQSIAFAPAQPMEPQSREPYPMGPQPKEPMSMGPQPSKLQPEDISLLESLGIVLSQALLFDNESTHSVTNIYHPYTHPVTTMVIMKIKCTHHSQLCPQHVFQLTPIDFYLMMSLPTLYSLHTTHILTR